MVHESLPMFLSSKLILIRYVWKISARRIALNVKIFACFLIGMIVSISSPVAANASDHITIRKELFIKGDRPIRPNSIVKTQDEGFIVAGVSGTAWAARIDRDGAILWRYTYPKQLRSEFRGVAMLPDDSAILCGEIEETTHGNFQISGLIVHISKNGTVLSEKSFTPSYGGASVLTYLKNCFAVDNGVVIVGSIVNTGGDLLNEPQAPSHVFLLLDKNGEIEFEKESPNLGSESIQQMSNKTFMTHTFTVLPHSFFSYFVSRVDLGGEVLSSHAIPNWSILIESVPGNDKIYLLKRDNNNRKSIVKLNQQLEESDPVNISTEVIEPKKAYFLSDHSLALFGDKAMGSNSSTSSIEWISPDFKQNEFLLLEPHYSSIIYAAIPTGSPGEFVLTRDIAASKHVFGADEKRTGAILTFVQIK